MKLAMLGTLVPVLLTICVLALRHPMRFALPLYILFIPVGSAISFGIPLAFDSASSLLGPVLGVGLLAQLMTVRRGSPAMSPTVPVWLLFWAWTGATVLWSVAPATTASSFAGLGSLVLILVSGIFLSNFEYKFFWIALAFMSLCRNVALTDPQQRTDAPPTAATVPWRPRSDPHC